MATIGTVLTTWAEFEQLPDSDGFHREIIEGELQLLPPPKSRHSRIASNGFKILMELETRGIGRVFLEAGYKLSDDPATWVQPDASFLSSARDHETDGDNYFLGAPDLAIEIVSPSESARQLQRKIELMLESGAAAVWVIYPKTRKVIIHLPDGTSFTRGTEDTLEAPYLLPGWQFAVARFFAD